MGFEVSGANSNFTEVWSTNLSAAPDDSIVHGPEGIVNGLEFHGGTTMTLYPAANPTVRGTVWRNGYPQGNVAAMAARSTYGSGRIFFVGDSSPIDDGSAAPGNSSIFDGWAEAAGGDSLLMLNATWWVTRRDAGALAVEPVAPDAPGRRPFPNPFRGGMRLALDLPVPARVSVEVYDVGGRLVRRVADDAFAAGRHEVAWDGLGSDARRVPAGLYFVRAMAGASVRWWRVARVD